MELSIPLHSLVHRSFEARQLELHAGDLEIPSRSLCFTWNMYEPASALAV